MRVTRKFICKIVQYSVGQLLIFGPFEEKKKKMGYGCTSLISCPANTPPYLIICSCSSSHVTAVVYQGRSISIPAPSLYLPPNDQEANNFKSFIFRSHRHPQVHLFSVSCSKHCYVQYTAAVLFLCVFSCSTSFMLLPVVLYILILQYKQIDCFSVLVCSFYRSTLDF